ncbi:MAG TPA: SNF2 helicase associated domain-containing protein [Clostridiaceae bacterium]
MFHVTESIIKHYTNDEIYKRGFDYYIKNKVLLFNITEGAGANEEESLKISAEINSSDEWVYEVEVDITNKGFNHFYCDCEEFSSYFGETRFCKHIVAVLLKYIKETGRETFSSQEAKVDQLLNRFKMAIVEDTFEKLELKTEVKYEFNFEKERISSLELRVGKDRCYSVKNMKEFLKVVRAKTESLEFGKSFNYAPWKYYYNEVDKELINLLLEIYEADLKIASINSYYKNTPKFISGKKAYLSDYQVKRFFNISIGKSIEAIINGKPYSNVKVLKEDMPLEFDFKLNQDRILINHTGEEEPIPLTYDGEYFFYKSNIYKIGEKQLSIYVPLYNELIKSNNVLSSLNKEYSEKVASIILPGLRKISKRVNIDSELEKDFYEAILISELYIDSINNDINCLVKFNYGEISINPLKDSFNSIDEKILIRNIEAEEKIKSMLKDFGFIKETDFYSLKDEDKIVDFIIEGIGELQNLAEVYYSEGFKDIKFYNSSSYKSSVKLTNNDLLEFTFSIEGVEKEELKNIFAALRSKKKYYKLKKGGFVSLETKALKDIGQMLDYIDIKDKEFDRESIILSKYNSLYFDNKLKEKALDFVHRDKGFREMVNNIREVQETDYILPEYLEPILREYQKSGFKWLSVLGQYGFGGILADEMGLGKTLQAISFIAGDKDGLPSLVIAPTSLVYNWQNEIEKFAPSLKTLVISGSKLEREELRKEIEDSDIVVTSYPLIRRDIDEYKNINFKCCILDEAQQIKNPNSINAKSVKELKAKGYFALTGTPIENSLTELWSIFDFIMPGYLSSHSKFLERYETPIVKNNDKNALQELNRRIKPFILRRLKREVAGELPEKIEHRISAELTPEQKKLYLAYLSAIKGELNEEIEEKGINKSKIKILAALTRLRQICLEPSIFIEDYVGESGKMLLLDDILEESIGGGHKILIFSQFTSVLKKIEERLNKNLISYMYLDGKTKAQDRVNMVTQFNEGDTSVFLISLKAGGTGLNLTGADVVIHFDPWWNPAVEDQASDRAHRIGQRKTVEVIKLIARGTIEEKIFELQEKKKNLIRNILDENQLEESFISSITKEELDNLFEL